MRPTPDQLSTALESLVDHCAEMIRRVAWRHRLSEADVDEVMQEVRIRIWHAHQRAEGAGEQIVSAPASYVYRTATSAALDLLRRRRARRGDRTVAIEEQDLAGAVDEGPEERVEASELTAQVARAIDTIHATRRPVVRMYLVGYPREEIARVMGWSEAKTRNLLYRGLADLRERLTKMGIVWENAT